MRKKIGMWLMAGFLLLQSVVPVYAAPDDNSVVKAVSGYCLGDELYAFIQLKDEYDADSIKVNMTSDAVSASGGQSLVPVTSTSATVRYVFMVDLSETMRKYAEKVNEFVDSLMETEKLQAFYTVATFGEHFKIVSENMTDKNTVKEVLSDLKYTEQLTDPYTGVESALNYLDGYSRKSGDLIHLVMITDGDPDLGIEDEEKSQAQEITLSESAALKIESVPEVIVSTICSAQWDERAFQTLSTGSGIHEIIDENQDARAAGEKMANYVDSLYRVNFKLSEIPNVERFSVKFLLNGNDLMSISLEGVPNLKLFSNSAQENPDSGDREGSGGLDIGDIVRDGDASENPDGEKPENEIIKEIKEAEDENADEPENGDTKEPGVEDVSGLKDTEEVKGFDKELILAIGVSALVIVVGICAIILMRKRNSHKTVPQPKARRDAGAAGGITMKLEVYSGNYVSRSTSICLADSLVIGSAPECDLVFDDPDVSLKNSRVFVKNQVIYIEDLNSEEGTALGGMRIQGQNRLRSGDVISIGNVEFCFKF